MAAGQLLTLCLGSDLARDLILNGVVASLTSAASEEPTDDDRPQERGNRADDGCGGGDSRVDLVPPQNPPRDRRPYGAADDSLDHEIYLNTDPAPGLGL
jgi:hypothetical protein